MRYFIDGYNVTKQDPATKDLSLEEQRHALEKRLRAFAGRMLGSTDYLIIWDGAGAGGAGTTYAKGSNQSEYTRRPSADDAIVRKVKSARERVGVVTSDNELVNRCKSAASFGVEIKASSCLFADAQKSSKKGKKAPMSRSVGIPANAHEINRELKALWGIEDE